MSDSLIRLVLRAQGRLPVAEPLLPSRYAAAPLSGLSEVTGVEPITDPVTRDRDRSPIRPPIPPDPLFPASSGPPTPSAAPPLARRDGRSEGDAPVAGGSPVGPIADALPSPLVTVPPQPVRVLARMPLDQAPRPEPSVHAVAPPAPLSPSPTSSEWASPRSKSADPAPANLDRRPSAGVSPFLAREAALAGARTAAIETPRPETPALAPDVHISIGRVEVHAAPERPAPVRAAAARHTGLSLADYLARRR